MFIYLFYMLMRLRSNRMGTYVVHIFLPHTYNGADGMKHTIISPISHICVLSIFFLVSVAQKKVFESHSVIYRVFATIQPDRYCV